ncbi:hypothetical protein BDZ97DRAFT_57021 [Flammula alnicola]|nr:hypothetical protein BDZ97DRAFT_57021 [Flammula alnicola]
MGKKAKEQQEPGSAPSSSNPLPPLALLPPSLGPLLTPSVSTPAPPATASSPSSYKPITDAVSIERLIGLARDSPPDSALGIVWRHAFEEGKKIGYSEGATLVDGMDINEVLKTGVERGVEKGIAIGRDWEKRAWDAAGHSNACITVACPP